MGEDESRVSRHTLDRDRDPTTQVVEIVSKLEGVPSDELTSIWDTIDDVLANVFSNPPAPEAHVQVTFTYEGYRITVEQDGTAIFVET